MDLDALRAQATRLYLRYAVEVVERFNLCPWAAEARAAGRVRIEVVVDPRHQAAATAIETCAADAAVDVALLVLPTSAADRVGFERLVAGLRETHASQHPLGQAPFALADFHPAAALDASTAERLVPFLRRTPDPTVQLVRKRRLDEVRGGADQGTELFDARHLAALTAGDLDGWKRQPTPLHTRIIRANYRTLTRVGADTIMDVLDDIAADRARSYAALGLA
jgi:hypothetical protein